MDSFAQPPCEEALKPKPLSVSQAVTQAKNALESFTVTLVGEVSEKNVKAGYKAAYFTVKDDHASLPCMMWLNRYRMTDGVEIGMKVEMTGRFSIYVPKGRMSFEVFSLRQAGEGDLRKRVADLARKLQQEGLMEASRKKPVPAFPERIGVVTSPRGDAVHDVLRTLRRRFPLAEVKVAGVPVEGPTAARGMIEALRVCADNGCDVILLVRGGGSFEDLMPFNDEALARAVAASPVPVVTGIGHEPDNSIADMVADLRCSTPTAAAENVSPSAEYMASVVSTYASRLATPLKQRLEKTELYLKAKSEQSVLSDPRRILASDMMTLDLMTERLSRGLANLMPAYEDACAARGDALNRAFATSFQRDEARMESSAQRLKSVGPRLLDRYERQMAMAAGRLHDLSPLTVLSRGYAMARDGQGSLVKSVEQTAVGQTLQVTVSDGSIICNVEDIEKDSKG